MDSLQNTTVHIFYRKTKTLFGPFWKISQPRCLQCGNTVCMPLDVWYPSALMDFRNKIQWFDHQKIDRKRIRQILVCKCRLILRHLL